MKLAARDRLSGLAWARPLERSDFQMRLLRQFVDALNGRRRQRWVLDDGLRLVGSLWADVMAFGRARLTLLLEPSADQTAVGLALVRHGLNSIGGGRRVRLEASDRDPALASALREMGLRERRTLTQMRWLAD